jgi:hypothetical protein
MLSKAFELVLQHVLVSPELPLVEWQAAIDNFVLLPEDTDHEVQIFQPDKCRRDSSFRLSLSTNLNLVSIKRNIPWPPQVFEGRRIDVYRLLNALKQARLASVMGPAGIRLSSVTSATCHYMLERYHAFLYNIVWLPSHDPDQDELSSRFKRLLDFLCSELQDVRCTDSVKLSWWKSLQCGGRSACTYGGFGTWIAWLETGFGG